MTTQPTRGATNTVTEYKGWRVQIKRVGASGEYDALATKDGRKITTMRQDGVGAKRKTADAIMALIDKAEHAGEGATA